MPTNPTVSDFEGIYRVADAARYLRAIKIADRAYGVDSPKLIRWIRHGLALPTLADIPGRELLITFEDLVSMRVIAGLRAAGISFHKIYEAEAWLREHTGKQRPFATEFLWTEQSDIFAEFQEALIAATKHGQIAMGILRTYIIPVNGLTFRLDDQIAESWEPKPHILMHPAIQFGAPCVKNTRIPTRSLWGMVEAGDAREWVAEAYEISEEEVDAAIDWERRLAA